MGWASAHQAMGGVRQLLWVLIKGPGPSGASNSSSVPWGILALPQKKWKMGTGYGCQAAASNLALELTLPAGSSVSRGDSSITGEKEDEDEDVKKRREKQRRRDRMRDRAADR